MTEISEKFALVSAGFTARVEAVPADAWENPAPCEGWVARDVVRHLVEWLPGFYGRAYGVQMAPMPPVEENPAGAWAVVRDAIQGALDDPETAGRVEDCGPPGLLSLEAAVDMTTTPDVLIHTWDLARAAGLDEHLDEDEVHRQLVAFESMPAEVETALRESGHFGPRVEVPAGADEQTRLLAFMGRDSA